MKSKKKIFPFRSLCMHYFYRSAVFIMAVILCSGCSMRPTVNLGIDTPQAYTVQAWGYPAKGGGRDDAVYNSLSINLMAAPVFVFVFPDGYKTTSREISTAVLVEHLAPVTQGDKGEAVSRKSYARGESNFSIVFSVGKSGYAEHLSLYSCKYTLPGIIGTGAGTHLYDFPLKQSEIGNLFSEQMRIGHDFVILGYDCD